MPNKLKKAKANDDVEELAKKEVNRLFRIFWSFQNIKRVLTLHTFSKKKKKEMARHFFLVNMKSYVVSAFSFCTPPTVSEKGVPTNP